MILQSSSLLKKMKNVDMLVPHLSPIPLPVTQGAQMDVR